MNSDCRHNDGLVCCRVNSTGDLSPRKTFGKRVFLPLPSLNLVHYCSLQAISLGDTQEGFAVKATVARFGCIGHQLVLEDRSRAR